MRKPDQTFFLQWNNFQPNLAAGFQDLLQEETMVDVTLAVEGKYLQAHKIVLSVSSSYFKDLFKINPCRHPIVILKDIGYQEMATMLDFMYKGEVAVLEKDMAAFLRLAEILKVRGLADNEENNDEPESAKMNGKDKGSDHSETETENGDENGEEERTEESDESDDRPSSPDSIKRYKDSLKLKVPENTGLNFESNGTLIEDSNTNSLIEAPKRKKRKLSLENSQAMEGPSTSYSQTYTINSIKSEVPDIPPLRLTNDETDVKFESSQAIPNQEFVTEENNNNNLNKSDAHSPLEPDFDIKDFLNPDEMDAIIETLYKETDLKGKVICYNGFKYKFYMMYDDGTKLWRCTARYKKCQAELEVHPALGVILSKDHNHPQPKR